MRRLLSLFVTLLCSSGSLFAQDKAALEAARLEMIRQAVIFYAGDTSLNHGKTTSPCAAKDLPGIKDCAKDMQGVIPKIESWSRVDVADGASLNRLAEKIKAEVVNGKSYRERMPQYQAMIDGIDNAAKPLPGAAPQQSNSLPDTIKHDTKTVIPPAGATAPGQPKSWLDGLSLWMILALLLSAAALAKSFLASNKKDGGDRRDSRMYEDALSKDNSNKELRAKLEEIDAELRKMNEMYLELQDNFNRRLRQLQQNMAEPVAEWGSGSNGGITASPSRVRYAKTADGNGFDPASLSDEPDNKKIFEITTDAGGQQATYRVAGNKEAQLFALSNMNVYLRDACDYNTNPGSMNSAIITKRPGRLELHGGRWKIISKAQISFS